MEWLGAAVEWIHENLSLYNEGFFRFVVLALLLATSWDASKGKRYAKEAGDYLRKYQNDAPAKVLTCPYGYGSCEAFPLGAKPCKTQPAHTQDPAEREAGSRDDEAPPVG